MNKQWDLFILSGGDYDKYSTMYDEIEIRKKVSEMNEYKLYKEVYKGLVVTAGVNITLAESTIEIPGEAMTITYSVEMPTKDFHVDEAVEMIVKGIKEGE